MSEVAAPSGAGPQEMPSWHYRFGFIAAVFGMFMAILDIQIVASSLNEIQAGVSASSDEISWIQTSYLVAEIIMIPLSGVLMRWLSTRVAFVISCAGFTLASLGCALANNIEQLIVLRAIQGFMGGAMIPITQAISFTLFPRRAMGAVQGVIGMVVNERNGPLVGAAQVFGNEDIMLISNQGTLVRTRVDEVSHLGRNTQGVRLIRLGNGEALSGLAPIPELDVDDEELEEGAAEENGADGADNTPADGDEE